MHPAKAPGCVLIVEDPLIRRFVRGILKRDGRVAVEVEQDEALRILRAGDRTISLLITNRPASFLEFSDALPLLYIAASPDPALAARFRYCRMLRKPFSFGDLLECAAALNSPG